jgi:carboxypeptidase PM20D1
MSKGSEGANVIPQEAWVVGNMRFSHHQGKKASVEAITALAKKYDIETVVSVAVDSGEEIFNSKKCK